MATDVVTSSAASAPRSKRWARNAAQVAAVLVIVLGVRAFSQRGIASGVAPALVGPDLGGHTVSLADLRGKPVLVHFWATWCAVCETELSTIDALARDHSVLTVATSSGQADVIRADLQRRGVSFPVVVDAEAELAHAWGVRAFPTSFFVGPEQRIRFAETGFTTSPGFRARLWLAGR